MAADLTTPMAIRLAQSPIRNYEYLGVFDPEFYDERAGIYALDPYQPGKVPVVLVHGLWSSPKVWVPMLDALRGDPALRAPTSSGSCSIRPAIRCRRRPWRSGDRSARSAGGSTRRATIPPWTGW